MIYNPGAGLGPAEAGRRYSTRAWPSRSTCRSGPSRSHGDLQPGGPHPARGGPRRRAAEPQRRAGGGRAHGGGGLAVGVVRTRRAARWPAGGAPLAAGRQRQPTTTTTGWWSSTTRARSPAQTRVEGLSGRARVPADHRDGRRRSPGGRFTSTSLRRIAGRAAGGQRLWPGVHRIGLLRTQRDAGHQPELRRAAHVPERQALRRPCRPRQRLAGQDSRAGGVAAGSRSA